ncbi:hypothetical protein CYY_006044 [Polysphondylium violaceum]|uniref:AIM24 family protein n=1 Tax=Polysphondylium violaceum TaxID=133409 RepID=A0A8J4PSD0_9MYCE|nr:hypothetical protein CYY_006044 [Polysphondylium violaceum]
MSRYSMNSFLQETIIDSQIPVEPFHLNKDSMLQVFVNNSSVLIKKGAMVGYLGNIKYEREKMMSKGFGNFMKKTFTSEGTTMMKGTGVGTIYIADRAKKIRIIRLENEAIIINGNDVLAHDEHIKSDIVVMKSAGGVLGGGLWQVKLEGTGYVAFTTHGHPLTLMVNPGQPVFVDPDALVAWSASLKPEVQTDISFRSVFRSSGESFQLKFDGSGWVVIQPYEEISNSRDA